MNEWLLIAGTILLSAFFAGSEIGYVSANRLKLEIRARKKTLRSKSIFLFLRDPEAFLSTTLIGNNIVNILYATLMAIFLIQPVSMAYEHIFSVPPSDFMILLIQTVIASIVIMVFGEIIPKVVFRLNSEALIYHFAIIYKGLYFLFLPFIRITNGVAGHLIRLFISNSETSEQVYRRQDIEMLVSELADSESSEIDRDDSEILTNVLKLPNKRVRESMIPRTEIVAVDKDASLQEALQKFVSSGLSKLPVYDGSIDNVIGVVFAYDLFIKPKKLSEIIRPVKHIPSSQKSKDLLSDFQKQNISLAIVIDEYGGTAGLITTEDLLEEVVGDIQDEYDMEEIGIKKISSNTFILSGDVPLQDLAEKYPSHNWPERNHNFETVAGYIINEIGRIPKVNEEVIIGNHKFIISKAKLSRIETVKLTIL
ncbi:hemolysin family protein [Balneolaceae bacterium ANBcel3]|nr:hemolysin family protein [Balneolaceae bacterium ANBcel3]